MVKPQRLIAAVMFLWIGALGLRAQFVWTGLGGVPTFTTGANWQGQSIPPGTADIRLGHTIQHKILLSGATSLHTIILADDENYTIDAASPTTLTLTAGFLGADDDLNLLAFGSNVTLALANAQVFDARAGQITVSGQITGTGPLSLIASSTVGTAFFIFNNTGAGNTYTGGTTIGDGVHFAGVSFWNSSPFGSGNVSVLSGAASSIQLVGHGTQTLANAFNFNGPGAISLRSWDDQLVFSGAITLSSNTIFQPTINQRTIPAPNGEGNLPIPGAASRYPIVFSGGIGEAGGARSLTVGGPGVVYLTGTNTYTGGTVVNGSLVFASVNSAPTTGTILANSLGYVGFADTSSGQFANFLSTFFNSAGSGGAIGIDTLPGNATVTLSDAINLTGFNASLRLGTASSAVLNGTITPQAASGYQFGNGGGTLYVTSNLSLAKTLSLQSSNLTVPLTLYLQGSNSYNGATSVQNGFLILDSSGALSSNTPSILAAGSSTLVGASYIGYTDASGLGQATFLGKFDKANTWGIVGFDTHQTNPTVTINGVNLTGFNDGVFIGTNTSAILTGTLTPSTVANANNAANTLRFTASQNGILTVNSAITGAVAVMLGSPAAPGPYTSGTIILNGANTYSGGTTINATSLFGPTIALGSSGALGSGPVVVTSVNGGIAALSANVAGIDLANTISLVNQTGSPAAGPQLFFTGLNAFTVSGNIIGDATSELDFYNTTPLTVTLSGDNSLYLGNLAIGLGTLNLQHNNAAGLGTLFFSPSANATVAFGGGATAPILYGINGDSGSLVVPGGTNLTFNVSDDVTHDAEFGGIVSGAGSLTVTAPTAPSPNALFLYGNNTYSGGTVIQNKAYLALGQNNSAGTGPVTLNAPTGGLVLSTGVTFTNPLTYTAGTLGGFGTFAPSGTANLTFDTGRIVTPGIGGLSKDASVGTLTLNTDVTFANGGTFIWGLQDVSRSDGMSLLSISGNLLVSATAGGFTLKVETFDTTNALGLANLTQGTPYSLAILTTTGTITGFNTSAFTIDATGFQNGTMNGTVFSLSQTGNTLYLNFTPVPEPSTYALLATGLGAMLLALRRRRLSLQHSRAA